MPATTIKNYAVSTWYMEHHDAAKNSHKFYQVFLFETGLVVLRWGRVGTSGQCSVAQYSSYDEGHDVALRQVYAKKSKGYTSQYDDVKFVVDEAVHKYTLTTSDSGSLVLHLNKAMEDSKFAGAKDAVLQHYVSFSEQAQRLLAKAATADLDETMTDYQALTDVWDEINDKHNEVQVVVDLAKQTIAQKLFGGSAS